jgi:hypothetical protein
MQNASTAAATAMEARATDDAESHVTFLLPEDPVGTHLSDIKVSTTDTPVQSAVANCENVPAPLLTQAVGLTEDVAPIFMQAFKAITRGFGFSAFPATGVAQAASV